MRSSSRAISEMNGTLLLFVLGYRPCILPIKMASSGVLQCLARGMLGAVEGGGTMAAWALDWPGRLPAFPWLFVGCLVLFSYSPSFLKNVGVAVGVSLVLFSGWMCASVW